MKKMMNKQTKLIWDYCGKCQETEDEFGYHHLFIDGKELTKNLKCIDCWFNTEQEWFWQDEKGMWHFNKEFPPRFEFNAPKLDMIFQAC